MTMKPKEISQLIENEINGDWSISNAHGCDLKRCLVRPRKKTFIFDDDVRDFWVVLYEHPETLEGYMIVFDDEIEQFGLAQADDKSYDYFLCYYKSFLIAFEGM